MKASLIDSDSEAARLFERLFALLQREDLEAGRSVYAELSGHAQADAAALPEAEAVAAVLAAGPVQAASPESAPLSAPLKKAVDAAHWQQVGAACLTEALIQGGWFKEARVLFDSIPVLDCAYGQDEDDLPVTGGTGVDPDDVFSGNSTAPNAPVPASEAAPEDAASGRAASGLLLTGGGQAVQERPLSLEAIYHSRHDTRPNIWKGIMACGVIGALRKRGEFLECGKLYAQMTQYGDYQTLRDLRARAQRLL